jgi:hypothetical protein
LCSISCGLLLGQSGGIVRCCEGVCAVQDVAGCNLARQFDDFGADVNEDEKALFGQLWLGLGHL